MFKPRTLSRREWIRGLPFLFAGCSSAFSGCTSLSTSSGQTMPIGFCHAGYLPDSKKRIIVRSAPVATEVATLIANGQPISQQKLSRVPRSDFGPAGIFDFSHVSVPGLYEIQYGNETSPAFQIGNVWNR